MRYIHVSAIADSAKALAHLRSNGMDSIQGQRRQVGPSYSFVYLLAVTRLPIDFRRILYEHHLLCIFFVLMPHLNWWSTSVVPDLGQQQGCKHSRTLARRTVENPWLVKAVPFPASRDLFRSHVGRALFRSWGDALIPSLCVRTLGGVKPQHPESAGNSAPMCSDPRYTASATQAKRPGKPNDKIFHSISVGTGGDQVRADG